MKHTVRITSTADQSTQTLTVTGNNLSDRDAVRLAVQKRYGKTALFNENRELTGDGSRYFGQIFRKRYANSPITSLTGCVYFDVTSNEE